MSRRARRSRALRRGRRLALLDAREDEDVVLGAVVSDGVRNLETRTSSKPATDMSSGTLMPRSMRPCTMPIATRSLKASTAVAPESMTASTDSRPLSMLAPPLIRSIRASGRTAQKSRIPLRRLPFAISSGPST
jgi:hypothetical protein